MISDYAIFPFQSYTPIIFRQRRPGWLNELGSWIHTSLSPIQRGFTHCFVNYKKGCTRLAVASDKVYQLLAHVRWFSSGTPASSTTKTGRHDIAESGVKTPKIIQIKVFRQKWGLPCSMDTFFHFFLPVRVKNIYIQIYKSKYHK